ncbi:MAG: SsrA-binding protein SmpB [Bacteroidetes bacterium]|nr:SsrA-binding protein SmpB [Bacteroidota bacterium]
MGGEIRIKNRKAYYQYFLEDRYVAGIQLTGTEIKSIRTGKVSLADSYCTFKEEELFVIGMHIAEYKMGTIYNHEPKRDRKLLLTRRELKKLYIKVREKGFTIIPILLFINEKGLAKLEIALAKGKHYYDKREDIKKKDIKREIERSE